MNAQRRIWTALWSIWRLGNEQTVGDTKMCTAYFKGDTAEARVPTWNGTLPVCLES